MHEITLITTIALGLTAALVLGLLAKRVGLSPIVGYLAAGIVIGPYTPGFTADLGLAQQLAEVGVILLMFGVGLNFHLSDLLAARALVVPGALVVSAVAAAGATAVGKFLGLGTTEAVVLGFAVCVASTVVLLRALMDHGRLESGEGRVAVGWLVVEDIITVLVIVLLPAFAARGANAGDASAVWLSAGIAVAKLVALGAIIAFVGARFVPWLLLRVARLRSRELFTLTVFVIAIAVATIGYVAFGASMALGAFLAGMVVGQSSVSEQAAADALPMRDAFAVLFFVSVGMLIDVPSVLREPGLVLGLLASVLVLKPLAAFAFVVATGHPLRTALAVAAGLGQIGEFSFIVAELARSLELISPATHHALLACALLSISVNSWTFPRVLVLERRLRRVRWLVEFTDRRVLRAGREANAEIAPRIAEQGASRVIVVGYGPVGRTIVRRAEEFGFEIVVIDTNIETVLALQAEGKRALFGDASHADILKEAGLLRAAHLVVTVPDTAASVAVVSAAREMNPDVKIFARARYLTQGGALEQAGAHVVCYDEAEAATALAVVLRAHMRAAQ